MTRITSHNMLPLVAVAACFFVSCHKEPATPDGLLLTTEKHTPPTAAKTAVSADRIFWSEGDLVALNGQTCEVTVDEGVARAVGFSGSGTVRGYYPAGIATSGADTDHPTVHFPSRFLSSYTDGRQQIALPMAALGDADEGELKFRHLSAAVRVQVRNSCASTIYIDSVTITSADQRLCGSMTVDLADADLGATATSGDGTDGTVCVRFAAGNATIATGDILDVQVPLRPIAAGDLTIRVFTHRPLPGTTTDKVGLTFAHTAPVGALARNDMATARVDISPSSSRVADDHAFSISADQKIYFSKGNLVYTKDGALWSFFDHQTDIGETDNVGVNYADSPIVSLFGWGTNGFAIEGRITDPTSTPAGDYGPASGDLDSETDWGRNPITNGGNTGGTWRTPTRNEWAFLWSGRINNNIAPTIDGVSASWCRATVDGQVGFILFPDDFELPAITFQSGTFDHTTVNTTTIAYSTVTIDKANWTLLENAGAVFLPHAGRRNTVYYEADKFYYWLATGNNSNYAYAFWSDAFITQPSPQILKKNTGSSVRLVRDVE